MCGLPSSKNEWDEAPRSGHVAAAGISETPLEKGRGFGSGLQTVTFCQ
jgi:hypothetical protein